MYTNKVVTYFSHLKDKYGGESVKLFRNWEFIVKKMVEYRNHEVYFEVYEGGNHSSYLQTKRTPSNPTKLSYHPQDRKTNVI